VDLHVHTALSPCAADEMTPPAIVAAALDRGLDMIAVCDHNTAGNVAAVSRAAERAGGRPAVIAGMELTSAEEVHVVALFPDVDAAVRAAARVRSLLPSAGDGYHSYFGEQPLLDAEGRACGEETAALALATPLDLAQTVDLIHSEHGLAVAAHVDRPSFSVFSQLGFFPPETGFDGVEVSRRLPPGSPRLKEFRDLGLPVLRSSDSHFLEELGSRGSTLWLAAPTFAELALCLAGVQGRRVEEDGFGPARAEEGSHA
jgi:hypothetical protein